MSLVPTDPNVIWLAGKSYPITSDAGLTHLATFGERITFGDPTARDDQFLSTWSIRTMPGGIGIEDYDEGSDAERIYWEELDSRYKHGITLPPLVTATRPSTISDSATSYPLGLIGTQVYVCFHDGADIHVFGWDHVDEEWLEPASPNVLAFVPVNKPVTFKGTNAAPVVFVPHGGTNGYSWITEDDAGLGELAITHVDGDGTNEPAGPVDFAMFTVASVSQLYAIESTGVLMRSVTTGKINTWAIPSNVDGNVSIDGSETPRHLEIYRDGSGQRALHCMTNRSLWIFNGAVPCFERTDFIMSPHPDNALGVTVWRPGENLHVTQGVERWQHSNANTEIPNTGPSRDDAIPAQFRGKITDLEPETSFLFATLVGDAASAFSETFVEDGGMWYDDAVYVNGDAAFSALLCDTSLGWHVLWESDAPVGLTWAMVSGINPGYTLFFGGDAGDVYLMPLRAPFHNARQGALLGIDSFGPTGYFLTGWFDAAMLGFTKIAADLSVFVNHATANERIAVSYQVDDDGDWVDLGEVVTKGPGGRTVIPFGTEANGLFPGVDFQRIRFRFDFVRGSTVTTSPVFQAFTLHFIKVPQDAITFTVQIDLTRDNEAGVPADTMRDELSALLTSRQFFELKYARRRYRALMTRLSGADAPGQDEKGMRNATFLALSRLDDEEVA